MCSSLSVLIRSLLSSGDLRYNQRVRESNVFISSFLYRTEGYIKVSIKIVCECTAVGLWRRYLKHTVDEFHDISNNLNQLTG